MRTLRIYFLNNVPIDPAAFLAGVIILYMTSLVLIYVVNGNLCLLTTFLQFFLPRLFNLCQHFTWKSSHTYREVKTFHILTIQILPLTCYCQLSLHSSLHPSTLSYSGDAFGSRLRTSVYFLWNISAYKSLPRGQYLFRALFPCKVNFTWAFPGGSDGKESACNAGDLGSIPGLGRSPGEGHGYPLQYSCPVNPLDRGAWQAAVHGVAKSQTWLSN